MMPAYKDLNDIIERMLRFIEAAGAIALRLRSDGLQHTYKGGDFSQALTEADLQISCLLNAHFGPRLIEEETAAVIGFDHARVLLAQDEWTFIGDPIDGTKPYVGGLSGWGIMVAACRNGWPVASVMLLPAWSDDRSSPLRRAEPTDQKGIILAGFNGSSFWAPTIGGSMQGDFLRLEPSLRRTYHIGWLPVAAARFTLDFRKGYFPWCESSAIADAALLATGRLDATLVNHKLWDLAPILPVLEPLGFKLFHWRDLTAAPSFIIDMFDKSFSANDDLWILCRDEIQAAGLCEAIASASNGRIA